MQQDISQPAEPRKVWSPPKLVMAQASDASSPFRSITAPDASGPGIYYAPS